MAENTFAAQMRELAGESLERMHAPHPEPGVRPDIIDHLVVLIKQKVKEQAGQGARFYHYYLWMEKGMSTGEKPAFARQDEALAASQLLVVRLTSEENGLCVQLQTYIRSIGLDISW